MALVRPERQTRHRPARRLRANVHALCLAAAVSGSLGSMVAFSTLSWSWLDASPARAATVLALSLPELVREADEIVIARAVAQSSRYRATEPHMIVTDVELRVVDSLKGKARAGQSLVATHLGGAVGKLGLRVPGEASFPSDRSVIVFLEKNAKLGELNVVGMSQGVLPIVGEGASAEVLPAGGDTRLMRRDEEGRLREGTEALTAPRTLRELVAEIRRLVAEGRAR